MKPTKYVFSAIFVLTLMLNFSYGQPLSIEESMFLNKDETADAIRFNPALLGLGHKFNVTLSGIYDNNTGGVHEFNTSIAFKNFGVGYNYEAQKTEFLFLDTSSFLFSKRYENNTNYYLSLGGGNKKFAIGISGTLGYHYRDYEFRSIFNETEHEELFSSHSARISAIYRPNNKLSFTGLYYNDFINRENFQIISNFGFGIGVKPLERLALYSDFYIFDISEGINETNTNYKVGLEVKPINGLNVLAYYSKNYYGAGIGIDLGRFTLFNKSLYNESSNSFNSSSFGINYSVQNKGSILPKPVTNITHTLSGSLQDYYTSDILFGILGKGKKSIHHYINLLDAASKEESTKGILLRIDPLSTGRFGVSGNADELGNAITRFKKSGKKVVVYLSEGAGVEEYYIATFADKIVMPRETYMNYGLSIDILNFRNFLKKLGIDLEVFSEGKYKLTFQGLIDSTTAEGEDVVNRAMDIVYDKMMNRIRDSRSIPVTEDLKKQLSGVLNARELLSMNLIDVIGWEEDAKEVLSDITGIQNREALFEKDLWNYTWGEPSKIAVIGVYGGITTGESTAPPIVNIPLPYLSQGRTTGSATLLRQLEDAFSNKDIKAVVLRVNSGGGSAIGSAEISDAIKRLKKKYNKPFIVSMGDAAASGGYYVSVNADKIFSDETTITGSIGVFFAMPKIDSLMRMLDIKAENYKRGDNSDIGSLYVELDEEKRDIIKKQVRYIYDEFIRAVSEGRKMSIEEVDAVAQGRVWLGSDAVQKRLVDEIGGLYEALKYAKLKSGIKTDEDTEIIYYNVAGSDTYTDFFERNFVTVIEQSILTILGLK